MSTEPVPSSPGSQNQRRIKLKAAKLIAIIGIIAMTAVLVNGFVNGNFSQDGAELLANPWGIVSFVDLYVALPCSRFGSPFARRIYY